MYTYVYIYIYIYIYICVSVYIYIYIYIHIHTYIHIHMHTYTYTSPVIIFIITGPQQGRGPGGPESALLHRPLPPPSPLRRASGRPRRVCAGSGRSRRSTAPGSGTLQKTLLAKIVSWQLHDNRHPFKQLSVSGNCACVAFADVITPNKYLKKDALAQDMSGFWLRQVPGNHLGLSLAQKQMIVFRRSREQRLQDPLDTQQRGVQWEGGAVDWGSII